MAMKQRVAALTVVLILVAWVHPVRAISTPVIDARTFGIELCPQSICGAAIFVGILHGQVGANPHAIGTFAVAVNHGPLPVAEGDFTPITGGGFEIKVGFRRLRGAVTEGVIVNNGDNTFTVKAKLEITSGGGGSLVYLGVLDHNVFPPTIAGTLQ
jgi:hypothetical protein